MTRALEQGLPMRRIEEASARRQARIDSKRETIVGLNRFRLDHEEPLDILDIDNSAVRDAQIRKLRELRATRDGGRCRAALEANHPVRRVRPRQPPRTRHHRRAGPRHARRNFRRHGESFGRYQAPVHLQTGVYGEAYGDQADALAATRRLVEEFAQREGRRPRILIAKMGQDGHDRGAKVIATAFADLGFDVDLGPLFQTPEETARQATENDVHIVAMSSLAAGHKTLLPQLVAD